MIKNGDVVVYENKREKNRISKFIDELEKNIPKSKGQLLRVI